MNIPEGLRFTKDHEWVKTEGTNALIGITEYAQGELGEIVFVDLPAIGKQIQQKGTLSVVESTKAASDVYAPISGVVKEVNTALRDTPSLVNSSPYQDGWMVKLEQVNNNELNALMSSADYATYLQNR